MSEVRLDILVFWVILLKDSGVFRYFYKLLCLIFINIVLFFKNLYVKGNFI